MRDELIKLAEEGGFESINIPKGLLRDGSRLSEIDYYLWMCELQKWLRDEKGINIGMTYFKQDKGYWISRIHYKDNYSTGKSYESSLEYSLIEALKLLS